MLSAPRGLKTCYKVRLPTHLTCQRLFLKRFIWNRVPPCSASRRVTYALFSFLYILSSPFLPLTPSPCLSLRLPATARPTSRRSRLLLSLRLPFTVVDPGRHAEDLSRCFFSRRLPSIVPTLLYQLFPRFLQSYLSSVTKCRVLDSLQRESTIENPFVGRRHVLRPRPRGAADERLRASRARPIITVLLGSYTLFIDQHGVVTQAAYTDEHSFVWLPRWRARTDHHQQRFATGRVNRRAQEGRVDPPRPGHDRQDPVKKV